MTHEGKRGASGGFARSGSGLFGSTALLGVMSGLMTLSGACADMPSSSVEGQENVESTEQGVTTCVTIQNVGPLTTAVDDANIITDPTDPTKANTNYGTVQQMNVGFVGTDYRRILMKFDLAGAGIPAGSTVSSATLTLRMIQSPGKNPVDLFAAAGPWSEASVTWNTAPALGALQSTISTLGVVNNTNLNVSLSAGLVESWINPATNYGLVFDHSTAGRTVFGSAEAPTTGPRPKLQVCYDAPSCNDGVQNGGETGVDCGGPCTTACNCELDANANSCASAANFAVAPGGSVSVTGNVGLSGDDYVHFSFSAVPGPGFYYHPTISLNDPSGLYLMYVEGSCGAGAACGTGLKSFDMLYPENPNACQSFGNCTDDVPKPTQWVVRVSPTVSAPVCDSYTLTASNI